MFKDIINLIKASKQSDGAGGYEIIKESEKQVFADKKSVKQTEFYLASQADLQAEVIFKINSLDYDDERIILHNDKYYSVIRTYSMGDYIELTCQKRLGGLDEVFR